MQQSLKGTTKKLNRRSTAETHHIDAATNINRHLYFLPKLTANQKQSERNAAYHASLQLSIAKRTYFDSNFVSMTG